MIEEISRVLADKVPDRYIVRSGERQYLALASDDFTKIRPIKPDVTIDTTSSNDASLHAEGSIAVAEPAELTMRAYAEEEYREPFVEILEPGPERRLVTFIELLSPSNKRPRTAGWKQYLRKHRGSLRGHVTNLIEVDLLRGGKRMPMLDPWPNSPYTILIARATRTPDCLVCRAFLRIPLPSIGVPLLKPDPDIKLELQPMIDAIYTRWKYGRSIDYTKLIAPPLSAEDIVWLDERRRESAAGG